MAKVIALHRRECMLSGSMFLHNDQKPVIFFKKSFKKSYVGTQAMAEKFYKKLAQKNKICHKNTTLWKSNRMGDNNLERRLNIKNTYVFF